MYAEQNRTEKPPVADPLAVDPSQPAPLVPFPDRDRLGAPLPTPLTSFVGREREIRQVAGLLRRPDVRLVTLTGPGGVGKTRLALRVAHELAPDFVDGVAFVPLAPVTAPELVAPTVAQVLGVRDAGDRPLAERLAAVLRDRAALLLLDNFEQVVVAAPLVADLLAACPNLRVLVTSRATLRVSGEHVVPVAPLGLADPDGPLDRVAEAEAVRLFAERAHAADPAFALVVENVRAVAAICARLDGLPLAVELGAAKAALLPPWALLDRLDRRLPVLTGGPRDQPSRLRTMGDAVAWSHDLLAPEEQAHFRRLAVFAGGFALEAAEAVAGGVGDPGGDAFAMVEALVGQSLMHRLSAADADEARFGMLETVREFGLERLAASGEEAAVRDRHAGHFLALAEAAEPHLLLPGQGPWLDRLAAEYANLRAALAWLEQAGEAEAMLRLAGALDRFWWVRGHYGEGRGWLERALTLGGDAPAALRAKALGGAGRLAVFQGDRRRGEALIEESLALWRGLGDREQAAVNLVRLGVAYIAQERYAEAAAPTAEALALYEELGEAATALPRATIALTLLGDIAAAEGDHGRAEGYLAEALARQRALGFTWAASNALIRLGYLARLRGDLVAAAARYRESLDHAHADGDPTQVGQALVGFAAVALAWGKPERAARLLGAKATLDDIFGGSIHAPDRADQERTLAAVRAALGEGAFTTAWAAGRALSVEAAVAEAIEVGVTPPVPTGVVPSSAPVPADPFGLSPREREVLALLARRLSDKEIAAALFVSPHTASTHVKRVLGKLGAANRREAAAVAARHGLA